MPSLHIFILKLTILQGPNNSNKLSNAAILKQNQ